MEKIEVVNSLRKTALELRIHLLNMCCQVDGALHIGGDLSVADILTALFFYQLKMDPRDARKSNRDRFILSKGHCASALYIAMAMRGFFSMDEVVDSYGQIDSRFGMHPCRTHLSCLETSSGSLGHGLPIAAGMALAARLNHQTHRIYTILGDGECDEGSTVSYTHLDVYKRQALLQAFSNPLRNKATGPKSSYSDEVSPFNIYAFLKSSNSSQRASITSYLSLIHIWEVHYC